MCDHYVNVRSVSGECNNLDNPSFGKVNDTMGGVLLSKVDRTYKCYEEYNGWQCYYNNSGNLVPIPKERDVVRFIHQESANMIGKVSDTPVSDYYNSMVTAMGVFLAHEIVGTEATASSSPADAPCVPFCGDFMAFEDQRIYMSDVGWDDSVQDCDYLDMNCTDEFLFEPLGAPPFLLQGSRKTYLGIPNFDRIVPWMGRLRHNKKEVVSGDGKMSPVNMVTSYLDLSNVYSSNITRHNMLLANDFNVTGKLRTSTIDSTMMLAHTDERTGYCSFTEFVLPNNSTVFSDGTYLHEKDCWENGVTDSNFGDPWCYESNEGWKIVDLDTVVSTCAHCFPLPGSFSMNIGGRCSAQDRIAGKCLPSNERRELCQISAARNNLQPEEYVISFTTGLLPEGVIYDWLPTAEDVGETFNADFFRNYGFPQYTSIAGDGRAHENIMLNYLQVLYLREHNRIASVIRQHCNSYSRKHKWIKCCAEYQTNGEWDGQKIFDHARIMNSGRFQFHVDNYLKEILGDRNRYKNDYDPTLNVKTPMEMAIASRKHTLVPERLFAKNNCNEKITQYVNSGVEGPNAHEWLNSYQWLAAQRDDFIALGLVSEPMGKSDELTILNVNFPIFAGTAGVSVPSFTLNRARDHNLGTYDEVYEHYFGKRFTENCIDSTALSCFQLLSNNDDLADKLYVLYGDVKLIDLWTGFLIEKKPRRSIDGVLQTKIQLDFFDKVRRGDRFWYKNGDQFNRAEMREFKKYTLRELIILHANDPEMMKRVLPRNIYKQLDEDEFDDSDECTDVIYNKYMPGFEIN